MNQPWATSQPAWRRWSQSARSSMPSATVFMPSLCAMSRLALRMVCRAASRQAPCTKLRSIFSSLNGMSRSCASEEWPVPKSSMDRLMRFRRRRVRISRAAWRFFIRWLSVTSSTRLDSGTPAASASCSTKSGKSSPCRLSIDTLTASCSSRPCSRQRRASRSALRSTVRIRPSISPTASARAMKRSG
ncbi:hypothetical protein D3C81_1594720 [compost metagenome]